MMSVAILFVWVDLYIAFHITPIAAFIDHLLTLRP